jgi:hypothetical protein
MTTASTHAPSRRLTLTPQLHRRAEPAPARATAARQQATACPALFG